MKYYQIHFDYGPEAEDAEFYYGIDVNELYSTKEKAEIRAKNLSVNSIYSEPYVPINYEILELEVIE